MIRLESPILGHVNAKLFRNVCILKMRAAAMHKRMGQSAQEQNITSQCADPDRDWEGVYNASEHT